jgi:hypothetical protein
MLVRIEFTKSCAQMTKPCITIGSGLFDMGRCILELLRAGSHYWNACKSPLLPLNDLMFVDIYTDFGFQNEPFLWNNPRHYMSQRRMGGHGFCLPFSYRAIDMYTYAFLEFCGSVVSVLNKNKRNKYHEISERICNFFIM